MDHTGVSKEARFRVPYINGKYLITLGLLVAVGVVYQYGEEAVAEWRGLSVEEVLEHKFLIIVFWLVWIVLSILGYRHRLSLLPVAGILINLYLMAQLGASNWLIFIVWLLIGLLVYFGYGYRHSRLNRTDD